MVPSMKSLVVFLTMTMLVFTSCGGSDGKHTKEADKDKEKVETKTSQLSQKKKTKKGASLVLATASLGGTFYPVGVAISTLVSVKLAKSKQITMNAINSAGSGENVRLLKGREADLAILQGLFGSMAWQGVGKYKDKPQKYMRSITMLWQNVEHFVILNKYAKTGNIKDLDNLKGKVFSIGKRGSGTETSGTTILSALGYETKQDFSLEHLGYSASTSAMQDKRLDGMNIPAGIPVSAITRAYASLGADGIKVLEFSKDQIVEVNKRFPVWNRFVIPKGTYPGQKEAINTIAQPNFLAVHKDTDEEVIYNITKAIYENLSFLTNIHKATTVMALNKAIAGLPTPLHPGAARYYAEQGIKIPKHLISQN